MTAVYGQNSHEFCYALCALQARAGLRKKADFDTIMSCDSIPDLFRTATAGLAPVGALTDWLDI